MIFGGSLPCVLAELEMIIGGSLFNIFGWLQVVSRTKNTTKCPLEWLFRRRGPPT